MTAIYDTIGEGYVATRAADPRITERLLKLLSLPTAASILDVGAGTGNYSKALAEEGYMITALEPSNLMREQGKRHSRLSWIDGVAENLSFESGCFNGVVMTLCMHHFSDWQAALREAARVVENGPIVVFSFDAELSSEFWLFDYFPCFIEKDKKWFPEIAKLTEFATSELRMNFEIHRFALPSDLIDHFAAAGWARPEIYLDRQYRSGISSFSSTDRKNIDSGLERLANDLQSGVWDQKYGYLRSQSSLDVGYVFLKMEKT